MKTPVTLALAGLLLVTAACSTQTQNSEPVANTSPEAELPTAPPKETGVNQAEMMLVDGAAKQMDIYAQMNGARKEDGPVIGFTDFITEKPAKNSAPVAENEVDGSLGVDVDLPDQALPTMNMTISLKELGLEKCELGHDTIVCEDAFATVAVTYRLEDGKVTAETRNKFASR